MHSVCRPYFDCTNTNIKLHKLLVKLVPNSCEVSSFQIVLADSDPILKSNLQGTSILMVVHFPIMQRIFSKQEDLMNFVNGGMMKKVEMQSAFVTVMVAIPQKK